VASSLAPNFSETKPFFSLTQKQISCNPIARYFVLDHVKVIGGDKRALSKSKKNFLATFLYKKTPREEISAANDKTG
jgi:hypothetical protein